MFISFGLQGLWGLQLQMFARFLIKRQSQQREISLLLVSLTRSQFHNWPPQQWSFFSVFYFKSWLYFISRREGCEKFSLLHGCQHWTLIKLHSAAATNITRHRGFRAQTLCLKLYWWDSLSQHSESKSINTSHGSFVQALFWQLVASIFLHAHSLLLYLFIINITQYLGTNLSFIYFINLYLNAWF